MIRSQQIVKVRDTPLCMHWTAIALPLAIVVWQCCWANIPSAALSGLVFLGLYASYSVEALLEVLAARYWGIGIFDITILPLSAIVRLTWISEKPVHELAIHLTGVLARVLVIGLFYLIIKSCGWTSAYIGEPDTFSLELVCNRLFWISVLLLIVDCVPVFPSSMGYFFRALLALNTRRIRATEITAQFGAFVSICCICSLASIYWIGFGPYWSKYIFFPILGIYFLVWSQQELADMRYFYGIRQRVNGPVKSPAMLLPEEQVVDVDCRPKVPNFSGFTFNQRTKLWIEWKDGEPISANALIGY